MIKRFFFFSLFLFLSPTSIFAQIGVNVAADHQTLGQAAEMVGSGGWVVVMAKPGDADRIQNFLNQYPSHNIVVRTHWPGTVPEAKRGNDWALSWTATLGCLANVTKSQAKFFAMPWNEPNMPREAGGNNNIAQVARMVREYTDAFFTYLDETNLRGNKVELLSPMINQSGPNYLDFINAVGGGSYLSSFYGVSMNLYDFQRDCGNQPICNSSPFLNAARYRTVLGQIGIANAKVFGLETGVVDESGTCPPQVTDCPFFEAGRMNALLRSLHPVWSADSNFVMASPLSYNPELYNHPRWIWGSEVEAFVRQLVAQGANKNQLISGNWSEAMKSYFWTWLENQVKQGLLIKCPGTQCGYGSNNDICQGTSFISLSEEEAGFDWGPTLVSGGVLTGREPDAKQAREIFVNNMRITDLKEIALGSQTMVEKIRLPSDPTEPPPSTSWGYAEAYYCDTAGGGPVRIADSSEEENKIYFLLPQEYLDFAFAAYYSGDVATTERLNRVADTPEQALPKNYGETLSLAPRPDFNLPSCEAVFNGSAFTQGVEKEVKLTSTKGGAKIAKEKLGRFDLIREFLDDIGEWIERWIFKSKQYHLFFVLWTPFREVADEKYRQEASSPFLLPRDKRLEKHGKVFYQVEAGEEKDSEEKQGAIHSTAGDIDTDQENYDILRLPSQL